MNSKVLNYLSEKKDNFMDWFEANKKSIKTNATKVIATGLTLAALTNMAGCNGSGFLGLGPAETLPPAIEVRPEEEIREEGITAEDVLAVYDQLAKIAIRHIYTDFKEDLGDKYYDIDARFVSMAPPLFMETRNGETVSIQLSFYPMQSSCYHPAPWFANGDPIELHNVYELSFNVEQLYKNKTSNTCLNMLLLSQESFNPIASSFNAAPLKVTNNIIQQEKQNSGVELFMYEDLPAFSNFVITRETILNANEEQLWALYNAATEGFLTTNFGSLEDAYEILQESPSK